MAGAQRAMRLDALPRVGTLDDRAGLNLVGVQIERLAWFGARWRRWRPNPWLVYLAHPRSAPPLAYGAFLGGVGAHAARRMKRAAVGRRG